MKILENLELCNGCHACFSICPKNCIAMQQDIEGFLFPIIDDSKCSKCGACQKICPMNKSQLERTGEIQMPRSFAVITKNEEIRMQSSNGGAFTLFAEKIINDGGVVFGARFNENFEVVHDYTETIDGLPAFRGSKYLQSRIGNVYKQVKDFLKIDNRKVLFCGTPCQIGGLKSYLKKEYENLLCVDFICHGIPSPKVWLKFIDYIEKINNMKTQKIDFRRKGVWNQYSVSFVFTNDTEYWKNSDTYLFFKAFFSDVCVRLSCHNCGFKSINRSSDITIADFWGVENVVPEMFDSIKGTSLVLIQNDIGLKIFDSIKDSANIFPTDLLKSIKENPYIINSTKINHNRNKFFEELDKVSFNILVKKYAKISINKKLNRLFKRLFDNGLFVTFKYYYNKIVR